MPRKKVLKLDPRQQTLFGVLKQSEPADAEADKSKKPEGNGPDHDATGGKPKKLRVFLDDWLKYYSWLAYDKQGDYMYCTLCTDGKKKTGMTKEAKCSNFQHSTLVRHASLDEHKLMIKAPAFRKDMKTIRNKGDSKKDRAMQIVFRSLHFLIKEDIALVKFKAMIDFLHSLDTAGYSLSDLNILKLSDIGYDSSYTSTELLRCMSKVVEDNLKSELASSSIVTALADESTDISNHKRLVIYAQIISEDMKPTTRFLTNIECEDATGRGLAMSILNEFNKRGVTADKIMSLGSDGASVMTGKVNGCAAIMRHENPHMQNVHCVAHKLALCTSQAAENIQPLKKHQQILTDLFYYFKGSAKRAAKLHEIQTLVDDPTLTIKEIHSVRWLSYFNALTAVFRTIDSLLTYLAEVSVKDPKANGLKKKIATDQFVCITYMMMDTMAPMTILSQFFQTENVDVALVKVKLDLCLSDLEKIKEMNSTYLVKLKEDLNGDDFRGHHVTTTGFNLQNLLDEFVDCLTNNIKSRFPENDLLSNFSVLAMRPLSFLPPKQLEDFGNEEIKSLCELYGSEQTVTWKQDGVEHTKTSQPLIDSQKALEEWKMLKKVVLAEQYARDCMWQLWKAIVTFHGKEFPNVTMLAKLALTSAVHTAGCERGFSVQNRILTTFRNRLNVETQHQLMRIKLDGPYEDKTKANMAFEGEKKSEFDFDGALDIWRTAKDRRLYELKALNSK